MKYYARIGDNEYVVEIEENQILVDGEPTDVDLSLSGAPELYSLLYGGHSYELVVEAERFDYLVTMRGDQYHVQIEDERTRKLNAGRTAPALPDGELAIKAPIPGLVGKVLVAEGEEVADGQPVILLEAMKMENELRSPRAGVVTKVLVAGGQRVEQNAILIVLE